MEKIPTLTQITSIPKRFDKLEYFVLNNINMTLIIKERNIKRYLVLETFEIR